MLFAIAMMIPSAMSVSELERPPCGRRICALWSCGWSAGMGVSGCHNLGQHVTEAGQRIALLRAGEDDPEVQTSLMTLHH